jgi:hypothetical protein
MQQRAADEQGGEALAPAAPSSRRAALVNSDPISRTK